MSRRKPGGIRYETAPDIQARFSDIVHTLALGHVDPERVICLRSRGSSSRRVVARCHGMGKVLQVAPGLRPVYVLEFISERFDRLDEAGRDDIIIHELLHIPKNFGGGFRHHDVVTNKEVRTAADRYRRLKAQPPD